MIQAHIANAAMLVVATPDTIDVRNMVNTAKLLRPEIHIVLRTHNEVEFGLLRKEDVGEVFLGEEELAKGMTQFILAQYGEN